MIMFSIKYLEGLRLILLLCLRAVRTLKSPLTCVIRERLHRVLGDYMPAGKHHRWVIASCDFLAHRTDEDGVEVAIGGQLQLEGQLALLEHIWVRLFKLPLHLE